MGSIPDSPLGKATRYPETYDAGLLYPVERAPLRSELALGTTLPFTGYDRWTAWEVTWLDARAVPQVAIATFVVRCTSPRIVESKSVKLWLASLYNERFDSPTALRDLLVRELSTATGDEVAVMLELPETWERYARRDPAGISLDFEAQDAHPAYPDESLLRAGGAIVEETLLTHTFRSVCPVTGQPDYACVTIEYRGQRIERGALAGYLRGYRREASFHEHCVERIFVDVLRHCAPERLALEACFTRRGGVDINPFRTTDASRPPSGTPALRQ